MKRILTLFLLFTLLLSGQAQVGFFKADGLNVFRSYGNCVVEIEENRYIGLGRLYREGWTNFNVYFAEFDGKGKVISVDTFQDEFFLHNDVHNEMFLSGNKVYALSSSIGDTVNHSYLLEYNTNTSKVSLVEDFISTNSSCSGFTLINDDEFFIVFVVFAQSGPNLIKMVHFKEDIVINEFYHTYNSNDLINGSASEIVVTDSNTIILGGHLSHENALYVPYFMEYDLDGNLLWEYKFPNEYAGYFVTDFLLDDGNLIISFTYENPENNWGTKPRIVKLNKQNGILWNIPFGQRIDNIYANRYNRILKSHENDGYVLGGEIANTDSIIYKAAAIGKVSIDGDSIWHRTYSYSSEWNAYNRLNDLEYTSDGGYLGIGGHSYGGADSIYEGNIFHKTLFLKTNKDGLIDGLDCKIDSTASDLNFNIHPNPTSEALIIFQKETENMEYIIYSSDGKLLDSFSNSLGNHSIIHDVSAYPKGIYYIHVTDSKNDRQVKSFVVQ